MTGTFVRGRIYILVIKVKEFIPKYELWELGKINVVSLPCSQRNELFLFIPHHIVNSNKVAGTQEPSPFWCSSNIEYFPNSLLKSFDSAQFLQILLLIIDFRESVCDKVILIEVGNLLDFCSWVYKKE